MLSLPGAFSPASTAPWEVAVATLRVSACMLRHSSAAASNKDAAAWLQRRDTRRAGDAGRRTCRVHAERGTWLRCFDPRSLQLHIITSCRCCPYLDPLQLCCLPGFGLLHRLIFLAQAADQLEQRIALALEHLACGRLRVQVAGGLQGVSCQTARAIHTSNSL